MKQLAIGLVLIAAACGSNDSPKPAAAPLPDARISELQTSLTELLERLDVINARLERLESGAPPPSAAPQTRAVEGAGSPQKLMEIYRGGIIAYGRSRYPEARTAFQQVFDADPTSDLADNALFWIGETYFAANDLINASRFYQRVLEEYGDQNKAPDALYKLALTHVKSGDLVLARKTLQQVIDRYPYSTSANAAKSELNRIKY